MTIKLSENIKKLREQKGVTQGELAENLSVTPQSVSRWEKGQAMPDIEKLPQIACYFGVTVDALMGRVEPSLYSISRELVEIRKQIREERTPEKMLKYLELLEQSVNAGSNIFLSEYISVSEKMKNDGNLIASDRADSVYETVRGKLLEMLPHERERKLVPIIINEDEDNLERWSDLVLKDNTFSSWNDYLLNRYLHKQDHIRFSSVRRSHLFDEISKLFYLMTQKSAHYVGGAFEGESEEIENCRLVKKMISVLSERDDDIFIFHRITAESRLLGACLMRDELDAVLESMERLKELLTLCKGIIGKSIRGSAGMLEEYEIVADRARFERAMFDLDMIMMSKEMHLLKQTDARAAEFAEFTEAIHSEIDPFYFVEDRRCFERLYCTAERLAKKHKPKNLSYFVAVETVKGNVYESYIPNCVEETDEEEYFLDMLRRNKDTHIKALVGFLCDHRLNFCVELPPLRLREALVELDAANLDTEILLPGLHLYIVKQNRVTLPQSLLLKYE